MITDFSNKTRTGAANVTVEMRSQRGFFGSLLWLLTPLLATVYGLLFSSGGDTFVHWELALSAVLVALAIFDFRKTPPWTQAIGALGIVILAFIFFLQGASHLVQSAAFSYFAYDILGQWGEVWSFRLFFYVWGVAVLLRDSQGKTRVLGVIALLIFLAVEIYRYGITAWGAPPSPWLRAVYLVPFVWLLLESAKKSAGSKP